MQTSIYEKLGISYLGKSVDKGGNVSDVPYLYKNKDLTTHGVIIGMTGSGKTGLGVGIIEEAAMDKTPCIVIDPKGDMGNLALMFDGLRSECFEEWIDEGDLQKSGLTKKEYANSLSKKWSEGIASFGQDVSRIEALKRGATVEIFTPGSSAGKSISILSSLEAPKFATADIETLSSLASSSALSILGLIGLESDEKATMLLTNIIYKSWSSSNDLSLETLIAQIIKPPFSNLGLFPIEQLYPTQKRTELAMKLNTLLANPKFLPWLAGESLDIGKILYDKEGRARVNVFSIAHLNDNERMFFVTLLLNRIISWMRTQEGSSNLKLLLYMDEIFGYFPPNANPPSKRDMLLLLKQARAYGVGVLLSTQNPVDLDYRGLSNIGSWFIGKLQTPQDQEKVAQGIVDASGGKYSKDELKTLLGTLKGRVFISKNIHEEGVELFQTRWTLSYLKGPMSLEEIRKLNKSVSVEEGEHLLQISNTQKTTSKPIVALGIEELFLNPINSDAVYKPCILSSCVALFEDSRRGIDIKKSFWGRVDIGGDVGRFESINQGELDTSLFSKEYLSGASFQELAAMVGERGFLQKVQKEFIDKIYSDVYIELFSAPSLKLESRVGESLEEFRGRLSGALKESSAASVETVKKRYQTKIATLEDRLHRARVTLQKESQDITSAKTDTIISAGLTVLGALFGSKSISTTTINRGLGTARKAGRIQKEYEDSRLAKERVEKIEQDIEALLEEMNTQISDITTKNGFENIEIKSIKIKPKRSTIIDITHIFVWDGLSL